MLLMKMPMAVDVVSVSNLTACEWTSSFFLQRGKVRVPAIRVVCIAEKLKFLHFLLFSSDDCTRLRDVEEEREGKDCNFCKQLKSIRFFKIFDDRPASSGSIS
jgi:hypothetical protein